MKGTLAELLRELGISPSVLRNLMRLVDRGGTYIEVPTLLAGDGSDGTPRVIDHIPEEDLVLRPLHKAERAPAVLPVLVLLEAPGRERVLRLVLALGVALQVWTAIAVLGGRYCFGN